MFVCFAVFIAACGTTRLMEIWNIWHPDYWLSGSVNAITALSHKRRLRDEVLVKGDAHRDAAPHPI